MDIKQHIATIQTLNDGVTQVTKALYASSDKQPALFLDAGKTILHGVTQIGVRGIGIERIETELNNVFRPYTSFLEAIVKDWETTTPTDVEKPDELIIPYDSAPPKLLNVQHPSVLL